MLVFIPSALKNEFLIGIPYCCFTQNKVFHKKCATTAPCCRSAVARYSKSAVVIIEEA